MAEKSGTDLEAIAKDRFERGHRINRLHEMRGKLLRHEALTADEESTYQASLERYEADPFGELLASIDTYFNLVEQGHMSLADARARITETAEVTKRLAELKGIPAKPL